MFFHSCIYLGQVHGLTPPMAWAHPCFLQSPLCLFDIWIYIFIQFHFYSSCSGHHANLFSECCHNVYQYEVCMRLDFI